MPAAKTPTHIYLSPHLDDAVLSCGGRIWTQAQAGEGVVVITIFGGTPGPDASLSSFAREVEAHWGQEESMERRRSEDLRALALLGAEPVHWPYVDCIYRSTPDGRFPYADEATLWGEIDPSDAAMADEVKNRIDRLAIAPAGECYVPIAIGRHIDHRIVRKAAEGSRHPLVYYEDFPYARDPQAVRAALKPHRWEPELIPLSEQALQAKEAAIACYASQMSTFWTSPEEMAASVRTFAEQTGSGTPVERYWRRDLRP